MSLEEAGYYPIGKLFIAVGLFILFSAAGAAAGLVLSSCVLFSAITVMVMTTGFVAPLPLKTHTRGI